MTVVLERTTGNRFVTWMSSISQRDLIEVSKYNGNGKQFGFSGFGGEDAAGGVEFTVIKSDNLHGRLNLRVWYVV